MANNLYREYSVDYTPQVTSGKMTVWNDTPVSPLNVGDTFSPIDGVNIQVNHVSISDEVIGTLFGRPVRQWKIEIEGDTSISTSIVYDFNNQNGFISGSMTVKNTGTAPVFTLDIGDTFTIPNVGTLTCYEISGSNDEDGTWTSTYEGISSTSKTKYSYTEEINGIKTVSIEVSGRGAIPNPEYSVGDKYGEYTIARISSSNDISTKEWTYTYEGEYPFNGITEQYTYSEEYDYENSPTSGDITVTKTATGERSGNGSIANPIWEIGTTTSIGGRGSYVITSHEIRYDTGGWTETCTGQNPAPTKTGVGYTERIVTFSEEIEDGETITKVNIEVSGKSDTQPTQPDGITGYTLTNRSVNYNETTKEYTTTWEGQNPAPDVVGGTETRYVYSEENGIKQVTKTVTGKASAMPSQPTGVNGYTLISRSVDYNENTYEYTTTWEGQDIVPAETSTETSYSYSESVEDGIQKVTKTVSGKANSKPNMPEGVVSYFLVNRSVDYNENTKEYTTTWEGQIPAPTASSTETTITISEADGIETYTIEVTGKSDTQPSYPSDIAGYTRTSRSVDYNQNTKEYTTVWEGQNPSPEEAGNTETRYTYSEEIDGTSTIKHVTKVVTGKSNTQPEQPSGVTNYTLTSRSVDYNETTKEYTTTWEGQNPAPASETATETKIIISEDENGIKKYTKEVTGYDTTPPSLPSETTNTYRDVTYYFTSCNVTYNQTTHEYSTTWEGQYPASSSSSESKITLNETVENGETIKTISYEETGSRSSAPSVPSDEERRYNEVTYYLTNRSVSYNETTNEYTTTWEGQNPNPNTSSTEIKNTVSVDEEGVETYIYEVSGKSDTEKAVPSEQTKTYLNTIYTRTKGSVSYNETTQEYTTTWEGQYPAPTDTDEVTEIRISLSEEISGYDSNNRAIWIKKYSEEKSGKSDQAPETPNADTKRWADIVYTRNGVSVVYNQTTKEYTTTWEGQNPAPAPEDEGANETNRTTYTEEIDGGKDGGYKVYKVTVERGGSGTMPNPTYSLSGDMSFNSRTYKCISLDKVADAIENTWTWTATGVYYGDVFGRNNRYETSISSELKTYIEDSQTVTSYSEEISGVGSNIPSVKTVGSTIPKTISENTSVTLTVISAGKRTETDENGENRWTIYYEANNSSSSGNINTKKETCTIRKENEEITSYTYIIEATVYDKTSDGQHSHDYNTYDNYSIGGNLSNHWVSDGITPIITNINKEKNGDTYTFTIEAHYNKKEDDGTPSSDEPKWEETNRTIEVNGVTARSVKGNLVVVKREVGTITKATFYTYTDSAEAKKTIGSQFGGSGDLREAIVMSERISKETTTINELQTIRYRHDVEVEI